MLGDRLRLLRDKFAYSQEYVGKKIGVASSTIGMYEQGRREPDVDTLKALANLYDVSIDYLVDNNDIKDDEYKALYNEIYNNPDLRIFFNQTKDLTKEEMRWVLKLVKSVNDEHDKNN
jgi:transcriptional regulator with XRE-family HTH domain